MESSDLEETAVYDVLMTIRGERVRFQVMLETDDLLAWFALYEQFESNAGWIVLETVARPGETVSVFVEEARARATVVIQNETNENLWQLGCRPTVPDLLAAIRSNPRPGLNENTGGDA